MKAGALVLTAVLTLAVVLFGSGSASAAPLASMPESSTVTITKLAQPEKLGNPASGEKDNSIAPGGSAIGGVVFEYYKVDLRDEKNERVDFATNAGQQLAAAATPQDVTIPANPTDVFAATDSATGETTATLDRGLYLVKEDPTSVPAGVTASAPFLLAVPMTDPTDLNGWLDHIFVYPKNSKIENATKSVNNAEALVIGNDVTWSINVDIPRVENPDATPEAPFAAPDYFRIDDTLTKTQLELNPGFTVGENTSIKVYTVDVNKDKSEPFIEEDDYQVAEVESADTTELIYKIELTQAGRNKLADAVNLDAKSQIQVDITTKVLNAEVIDNEAVIYPNYDSTTNTAPDNPPLTTPKSIVKYGSATFTKISTDSTANLAGAEFRVYSSEDGAIKQNAALLVQPLDKDNESQTIGTWKTDENGSFTIEGLRYSNWADGEEITDKDAFQTYWLVETKALEGHQLLAEPIKFTITSENPVENGFEIKNYKTEGSGFELPLTGGTGTTMLTIAGIAILGVVLFLARRRASVTSAE